MVQPMVRARRPNSLRSATSPRDARAPPVRPTQTAFGRSGWGAGARPVLAAGHPPPVPHRCLMLVIAGTKRVGCAPALLRRKWRLVRSSFSGEFNAALVAPSNSAEGRNLAAGMERQPGRSGAVCPFGRAGVLGQASLPAI
jgi:hypothetical protein